MHKLELCLIKRIQNHAQQSASSLLSVSYLSGVSKAQDIAMASSTSGPGLLYVNSKITSPSLSPKVFTEWYEDIHIRDIFLTSGINSAFRYYTQAPDAAKIERPYLALYPVEDVGFLYSEEFRAIPVYSDMLPAESKGIFDLADFDTRYYTNIGILEGKWASACK